MKKSLFAFMMLIAGCVTAQTKKFDFVAVMDKDTVHVETVGGDLALQWNNGHVDLYPYSAGVYDIGTSKIICFDDFTLARYMILYYKKDHQLDFAILQYNNGEGLELKPVKK